MEEMADPECDLSYIVLDAWYVSDEEWDYGGATPEN